MANNENIRESMYEETVVIPSNEIDRINRLLEIESLEEMSDGELLSAGANTNWCEGIFAVKFADGSSLNFDLCSGTTNYFDDVVWTSADGSRDVILDCEYALDDIEFEHEGVIYLVHIVKG